MYKSFLQNNPHEFYFSNRGSIIHPVSEELDALFEECAGVSIRGGLYRVHSLHSCQTWSILLGQYYPTINGKLFPFGFDWLGRQYCLDPTKKGIITMLDPATIEAFEVAQTVEDFHNKDLVYDRDQVVSENAFNKFRKNLMIDVVPFDSCIATKVPLFIGGSDDVNNYQIANLEVYWDFQSQIYEQVKDLPAGTKIRSVTFTPDN